MSERLDVEEKRVRFLREGEIVGPYKFTTDLVRLPSEVANFLGLGKGSFFVYVVEKRRIQIRKVEVHAEESSCK